MSHFIQFAQVDPIILQIMSAHCAHLTPMVLVPMQTVVLTVQLEQIHKDKQDRLPKMHVVREVIINNVTLRV